MGFFVVVVVFVVIVTIVIDKVRTKTYQKCFQITDKNGIYLLFFSNTNYIS